MIQRLLVVFILGFASGLPLSLVSSTLQAWFAVSGLSVMATSMLSLVGLPYLYRALWAPLLDKYSLFSLGKRRSWIITMQLLLLLGFNWMAWLSPLSSPRLMAVLAFFLACFSATQDVAIDSHRTEYLPLEEHGLGASVAMLGYRIALLLGGGLALLIAAHFTWTTTYRVMGFLMIPGMIAVALSREPSRVGINQSGSVLTAWREPFQELMSRPGIVALVCFIFFYKLGEAFTTITSGIVMPFLIQGLGFSLDTIAYVNKIIGVGATIAGGLLAGVLLIRWSLFQALLVFGLVQAVSNLLFVVLAVVGKNVTVLALAVICDNFAAGLGSTALVVLIMRIVNQRFTATQFAILTTLAAIPRVFSGPIAAFLQMAWGWTGMYCLSFFLALGFIPFLMQIKGKTLEPQAVSPVLI